MTPLIISVFALALAAVALVYAVWTISETRRVQASLQDFTGRFERRSNETLAAVERTTNSKLAAEVDALRGALDVLRASNRREFSTIHGRLGGRPPAGRVIEAELVEDDDIAAHIALQSAAPVRPGNGSV